ncbi:MAG: PAS domain S-box protein, partial [Thermodesulfovibrionia bacterium]|nr:PAS domain S-box protein [Thermodesulfovibrionia bacterium]
LFGYRHDEIIGKDISILIPDRFQSKHREDVASFFLHPRVRPMGTDFEIYALKKNGEEFPADISLSPLQTDEELFITAAIRDITKRKQVEEQIELNYHVQKVINSMLEISLKPLSLESQFEHILDLILSAPHLALQSKGALYLVEDKPEVLVMKAQRGFSDSELIPCKRISFGTCLCGKAASMSEVIYSDLVNNRHEIHHEGIFPHGHYCVPILSGGNALGLINVYVREGHKRSSGEEAFLTSVAKTLAGIIERSRTEIEKKRLQVQLSRAEKLAAIGRFTANVAHEIRNPLTAIGGFARRLNKNISEGTKEKEYTNFIISEVDRLEGVLKNVLSFSREVSPHLEEYSIHEIVDTVITMNEVILREKSITIQKSFHDVPKVRIDKAQVHEALENIILNAIDSMPKGGSLRISIDKEVRKGNPYVYVKIQDSGMGIPQEELDLIYEPFYTTKMAEKGTGLGLSITKKIVEDHGGFIKTESTVGKGATFGLYFPCKLKL